jgi:2-polyprenyl-6-methoxyphenol hydroxylase-like FAD-dependent oxidoreductase
LKKERGLVGGDWFMTVSVQELLAEGRAALRAGDAVAARRALVGDAGYTRDPVTGQGISDAFRDAELCCAALDQTSSRGPPFAQAMAATGRVLRPHQPRAHPARRLISTWR